MYNKGITSNSTYVSKLIAGIFSSVFLTGKSEVLSEELLMH